MSREIVQTGRGYEKQIQHSAGVIVSGRTLYTAGLTARDGPGNIVGVGDMSAQIKQAFQNVEDVLKAAGTDFSKVVKYMIHVTDIDAFLGALEGPRWFMVGNPASTLVQVARLAHPDLMIEVEAVAAID